MALTPEAEAQIAARRAANPAHQYLHGTPARLVEPLEHASRYGAHTLGAVSEITIGMEIWCVDDGRRDWHGDPLGGIVVAADAGGPDTVTDDGEIIRHPPTFRCYDPLAPFPHRAFRTLAEDEINPGSIAPANISQLVHALRRFCRHVAARDRGQLDGLEAQLVADAHRLAAVVMGRR